MRGGPIMRQARNIVMTLSQRHDNVTANSQTHNNTVILTMCVL